MCFDSKNGQRELEIEILPDGTVKVLTGDLSGPAHLKAAQFMAFLEQELGGTVAKAKVAHEDIKVSTTGMRVVKVGGSR